MAVRAFSLTQGIESPPASRGGYPFRRTFVVAEGLIAVSGVAGTIMLFTNTFVPDVSALRSLGLHSWTLPGIWLFVSVVAPSVVASWRAARRLRRAPEAVMLASALLVVELVVQLPFLGFDPLQPIMGVPALILAGLAVRARRDGWHPPAPNGGRRP